MLISLSGRFLLQIEPVADRIEVRDRDRQLACHVDLPGQGPGSGRLGLRSVLVETEIDVDLGEMPQEIWAAEGHRDDLRSAGQGGQLADEIDVLWLEVDAPLPVAEPREQGQDDRPGRRGPS